MTIARGLIAGAAGTVTLNTFTYLDMAVRGRPASSMPAQTVEKAADATGTDLSRGEGDDVAQNRSQGLGALLGYVTGLTFGALYGAFRIRRGDVSVRAGGIGLTLAAMAGANLPPVAMGITDPREWGTEGWMADIIPHLAYGFVTAAVYDAIDRSHSPRR